MEPSHLVSAAFPALRTVLVNRNRAASTFDSTFDCRTKWRQTALSPVAHLFIDHARAVAKFAEPQESIKGRRHRRTGGKVDVRFWSKG